MWPHRRQPTRLPCPWDSPGKNTGVSCHFLLQCLKVKSESEDAQSCPTLSDPMDCSLSGSSVHGIFQARVWSGVPLPSPVIKVIYPQFFKDKLVFSKETIIQWEGVNVFFFNFRKTMILHIDTIYRIWTLNFFPSFHSWNRHGLWADRIPYTPQNLCFFLPWHGRSVIISSDAELGFSGFLSWTQWAGIDLLDEGCSNQDSPHVTSTDGLGQWAPACRNSPTPLSYSTESTLCRGHPTLSYL